MSCYFLVQIFCTDQQKRGLYDEYIHDVKPIVESYGGEYLIRSEDVVSLSQDWKPDRVILIRFSNREKLDECFHSQAYLNMSYKREMSVESHAIIIGGYEDGDM